MKVTVTSPGTGNLAGRACELGYKHAAAGIAPFGDPDHVRWDAGSADLMTALGETGPTTAENDAVRRVTIQAYCAGLESGSAPSAAFQAAFAELVAQLGLTDRAVELGFLPSPAPPAGVPR